jgi:hypothetical protein
MNSPILHTDTGFVVYNTVTKVFLGEDNVMVKNLNTALIFNNEIIAEKAKNKYINRYTDNIHHDTTLNLIITPVKLEIMIK